MPESLSWSPDGTQLAYGTREGRFHVGTGPEFALVEGATLGPSSRPFTRWSPAGDQVLLGGAWFDTNQVHTGLWLLTPDSGKIEVLVPPSQVVSSVGGNTGAVHDAQWSPDGTRIAFPYRGEAWLATPGEVPERLTQLTEEPLTRDAALPFDGVRYAYWDPSGERLALELSCDCGTPWSGAAFVPVGGDLPVATHAITLMQDGLTVSGWTPDGRVLGQNVADWSPGAVVDGYAVSVPGGAVENLTRSGEGRDPLVVLSPESGASGLGDEGAAGSPGQGAGGSPVQGAGGSPGQGAAGSTGQGAGGSTGQGAAGSTGQEGAASTDQEAAGSTDEGAGGSPGNGSAGTEAPLYQTGPVQWGSDGSLLYETYSYADHPVPHRGFVVRRPGESADRDTAIVEERIGSAQGWFTAARLLGDGRVAFVESGPGPVMPLLRAVVGDEESVLDGLATAVLFSPDATRLAVVEGNLTGGGGAVKVIELPVR